LISSQLSPRPLSGAIQVRNFFPNPPEWPRRDDIRGHARVITRPRVRWSSVTSARPPATRIASATVLARPSLRPCSTTLAPSAASILTVVSPSPALDPVTSVRLSVRRDPEVSGGRVHPIRLRRRRRPGDRAFRRGYHDARHRTPPRAPDSCCRSSPGSVSCGRSSAPPRLATANDATLARQLERMSNSSPKSNRHFFVGPGMS
jgi:hypothetical protein